MAVLIEDGVKRNVEVETATSTNRISDAENTATAAETADTTSTQPTIKKKPNKLLKLSAISLAAIGVAVGTTLWWQHMSSIEETDDAVITGHVHQLGARVAGTVIKVTVDDNQHVKAGQLLVQIDPRDLQLSAESAQAAATKAALQAVEAQSNTVTNARKADSEAFQATSAVDSARAQITKAQESLADAKLGVILSKTQIQQRQAQLTMAEADYKRYATLIQDRAVTTQSYDRARQDRDVAQANLDAAQATYTQMLVKVKESEQSLKDTQTSAVRAQGTEQSAAAARAETTASQATVAVQQAAAKQAQIEYQNAMTQLSYTKVLAPINGTVGHKTVEVGQQIERGQALMSIVSDEKWVVANFKETQLGRMHVGQEVDIKIDALPNKEFKGHVDSMSPASGAEFSMLPPDNASGNYTKVVQRIPVKIVFDPASIKGFENLLTPGMSVIPEVHVTK